jgi:hypothetical protein
MFCHKRNGGKWQNAPQVARKSAQKPQKAAQKADATVLKFLFTDGGAGDILLLQKEPFTSGAVNFISQKGEVTSGLLFFTFWIPGQARNDEERPE